MLNPKARKPEQVRSIPTESLQPVKHSFRMNDEPSDFDAHFLLFKCGNNQVIPKDFFNELKSYDNGSTVLNNYDLKNGTVVNGLTDFYELKANALVFTFNSYNYEKIVDNMII